MKQRKSNLRYKIWLYLIVFSFSILIFLWLFQVIFLDSYYKWYKTKELIKTVDKIALGFNYENYEEILDTISYDKGVCIELVQDRKLVYLSNVYSKGCLASKTDSYNYKENFIKSNNISSRYTIENPKHNNKTLILAIKLNDTSHLFVSASLEPLDATVVILRNQLFYITLLIIFLSLIISYFIAKIISNPIIKMNKKAKLMANGDYNVKFDGSDIEEINDLTNTLNYACSELNKTEDLRRELMANVSHDLKTPLTMIKAYAELIRDVTINNKKRTVESLNIIIEETDRLNLLVNDILDLSSIQAKSTKLKIEEFDLNQLIKSIINRYDIWVTNENYTIDYQNNHSIMIKADKKRIEQVIYNLINNAINYTGNDKLVTIKVKEENNYIRVSIIDTGKGINENDLKYIWDKYYKVDKTHSRVQIGTGIGLSIVKNILINHGFNYGVNTKKNKGTEFYFDINK
ncbi:MAG: HAMP domain-containing histidine kinase [Bacilli bacterium]|nr:HAMP domain-containing histidine kinase [Bacilli bacterium]